MEKHRIYTFGRPDTQGQFAREPVLRRMADGSLVCLFLTGGPTEPHNDNHVVISRSLDDGCTWSVPEPLFSHRGRAVWATELSCRRRATPSLWSTPTNRNASTGSCRPSAPLPATAGAAGASRRPFPTASTAFPSGRALSCPTGSGSFPCTGRRPSPALTGPRGPTAPLLHRRRHFTGQGRLLFPNLLLPAGRAGRMGTQLCGAGARPSGASDALQPPVSPACRQL